MKVLLLRDAAGTGAPVALHPQVTVLRHVDPQRRAWLRDVLGRLSGGGDPSAAGELDAHGILFDLDAASLALLGLDRPVAAVVTAADLPGHDHALAAAERDHNAALARHQQSASELDRARAELARAVEERDLAAQALDQVLRGEGAAREAIDAAAAERSRLDLEVQAAKDEVTRADEVVRRAVAARDLVLTDRIAIADRIDAARHRRSEAIAEATNAAAALEAARATADPSGDSSSAIADARARLALAEQELAESDPYRDESAVNRRLAALEQRRMELARVEASLGEPQGDRVAAALERASGTTEEGAPVVAALALADTWRDLHQQIAALDAGVSPSEREAEDRLGLARQTVAEAESEFNQPVLTPEQYAKVEASHTAVLEAQDRAEGRFGGQRAKKRLEELRGEERRVLERLGFSTYADYMMSASSRGMGPANRAILDAARGNMAAAEEELGQQPGALDRARRRTELLQRRDAVAPRVAALLGHEPTGPESEDELRSLRETGPSDEEAEAELATALLQVGVHVGPAPYEREDLELLARAYLAEERSADAHRQQILEATEALDRSIAELRDARTRGATELPDLPALPELAQPVNPSPEAPSETGAQTLRDARWSEAESARTALAELEAQDARRREASAQVEALQATLAAATAAESEAASALAAAEASSGPYLDSRVEAATTEVDEAQRGLERAKAVEAEVIARAAETQPGFAAEPLVAAAESRRRDADTALAAAAAAEQAAAAALAEAEASLPATHAALQAASEANVNLDRQALVEDFTWAVLGRLAAVRAVGLGGSVPLVLDEPFAALADDEIPQVMDRVVQMSGAVQVVVLSDRDAVAVWAASVTPDRAGVIAA